MPAKFNTIQLPNVAAGEVKAGIITEAVPPCNEKGERIRLGGTPVVCVQTELVPGSSPGGVRDYMIWADISCRAAGNARFSVRVDIARGARVALPFAGIVEVWAVMRGFGGPAYRVDAFVDWFAAPSGIECLCSADDPLVPGGRLPIGVGGYSTSVPVPSMAKGVYLVGDSASDVRSSLVEFYDVDGNVRYRWDNANDAMPIEDCVTHVAWKSMGAPYSGVPTFVLGI